MYSGKLSLSFEATELLQNVSCHRYTKQMSGSCYIEKGQSVLAVTISFDLQECVV